MKDNIDIEKLKASVQTQVGRIRKAETSAAHSSCQYDLPGNAGTDFRAAGRCGSLPWQLA